MCLLDNREVRKGWEPLKAAVAGLFTKHGAKILSSRRWDERRLAYPIKNQVRATYLLLYLGIDTTAVPALRRELQFSEVVLRNMITECEQVPEGAYEPEAEFDYASIPVDNAPDEGPVAGGDEGDGDDRPARRPRAAKAEQEVAADDDAAGGGDADADETKTAATTEGGEETQS